MKKYNEYKLLDEYAIMYVQRKDVTLEVKIDLCDIDDVISIGAWHAIYDETLKTPAYYICHRYKNKTEGKGCIKLHRFITDCPRDKVIDHVNHDTLDNRRSNLRICTTFENQQNLRSNKSGIVGVHQRSRGNWIGQISKDNKRYSKEFKTKEEAIKYREEMYNKLYKEVM